MYVLLDFVKILRVLNPILNSRADQRICCVVFSPSCCVPKRLNEKV